LKINLFKYNITIIIYVRKIVNMKMKKIIFILMALTLFVSCSQRRTIDVKSPCVSNEDGPCGPKRLINDWWLKDSNINS